MPRLISADDPAVLVDVTDALRSGLVVGLPTETVYGLATLPEPVSLERLIAAKGRSEEKGIALVVDSLDDVEAVAHVSHTARRLATAFWPGPLTLVLPVRHDAALSDLVTGGRATVAFRMPDHPVPRSVARAVGTIALTSANRSGERDARTAAEVVAALGDAVAVVVDDGPVRGGHPSTVCAVAGDGIPRVLRAGPVTADQIDDALRA